MKKFIIPYLPAALIVAANITLCYLQRSSDNQLLLWVVFVLVWFNTIFGLLVFKKQPNIYWIYQFASILVLTLAAINFYWLSVRTM